MDNVDNVNNKGLNIVHLNMRSLFCKNKFEMFKQQLMESNIHVLGISETWLKKDLPSDLLNIKGYDIIRNDRNWLHNGITKKGGGVCMYLKSNLIYSEQKYCKLNSSSKDIESQWISLKIPNIREIVIINLYRPPQGNIKTFCDKLNDDLSTFNSSKKIEFYLIGDFNINMLNKSSDEFKELCNVTNSFGLKQLINNVTRFSKNDNCLGNIFSNCDVINKSGTLDWNFSDHQAVYINRKKNREIKEKSKFTGRSYRNYNKENFQERLREFSWYNFFNIEDPDICWDILYERIIFVLDDICPEKEFNINVYREPWMNKDIMEKIIDKDKALKKAKNSNKKEDWDIAKYLRNSTGKFVEEAKINYMNDNLESSYRDPKQFWRNIFSILPSKKQKQKSKIHLKNSDNTIMEDSLVADYINDFFTNIGPDLAKNLNDDWEYFGNEFDNEVQDIKINKMEVINFIKEIDLTKSSGLNKISSQCLKDALLALSAQLIHIFTISLKYSIFPKAWKMGTIVPLFKSGKKDDVSNYRPVSLLPVPGKILEKIVHSHLVAFFENNNLLCERQGGFRKDHSTLGSIADFTTDIFNAINSKDLTVATFFDLKKAFDTVDHSILIKKLSKMGIQGNTLRWLENYLLNRKQRTICNNILSQEGNVICGVPQGSILGPLLFLVYINDISNIFENAKFQLYADDTVIYCSGKSMENIIENLQTNMNRFANWCRVNKLTINTKKTKVMCFGSRHNVKKAISIELKVNDQLIQNVPTYKYLGINLDQTLNFNYHLKNVVNTISRKLYIFSKIRRFLNVKTSIILYKTMILPFFDYGDVVYMFSNSNILHKLDRMHLRGLKISLKADHKMSDNVIFNDCKISNLCNRRHVHLRNFMFNKRHQCAILSDDMDRICTRSNSGPKFLVTKPNCEAFKRSICYSGAVDWNSLNPDLRNLDNISIFKNNQKSWLLKTYLSN